MKLIVHRLLLAIIWVPTVGIELVMFYDFKRDVTLLQMLQDHYQAFIIVWCVALLLSLVVNWIMAGNMHNWAGKMLNN